SNPGLRVGASGCPWAQAFERELRGNLLYPDRMPRAARDRGGGVALRRGGCRDEGGLQCAQRMPGGAVRGLLVLRVRDLAGAIRPGLSDVGMQGVEQWNSRV